MRVGLLRRRALKSWLMVSLVAWVVLTASCSGGESGNSSNGTDSGGADPELTKNWGPEELPDQNLEPLQFLYWRVDGLFERLDLNRDGKIDLDEYEGATYNFDRMDTDGDGFITKKEVIDDMTVVLREEGKIP